jgi:hypothetical protein
MNAPLEKPVAVIRRLSIGSVRRTRRTTASMNLTSGTPRLQHSPPLKPPPSASG